MEQELNGILKSQGKATDYMREVLIFLNMHFWIYNGHMTQVLSDSESPLYHIPSDWQEHLLNLSPNEVNEVPFGLLKVEWPESLKDFVTSALQLGCMRFLPYCPENSRNPCERPLPSSLIRGIKPKKLQEVEGMARLVASICSQNGSSFVLDIGAGMGYLDQVLHYRYGLRVIGVDTSFSHGAQDRIDRSSTDSQYCSINVSHIPFTLASTNESMLQLQEILNNVKQPSSCACQKELSLRQQTEKTWVVVALHACGGLTRSVFQFYKFSSAVTSLICLSCCYHKMEPNHFPMSSCLQECVEATNREHIRSALGVYGLRLASQETRARWATATHKQHLERTDHTFFRATIEHALDIIGLKWKRPQRRIAKSSYKSFETYSQAALVGYGDSIQRESMKSYARFESYKSLLGNLNLLQILLQPVLESLILLDRGCYLNFDENNSNVVWLEAVAQESLSPRNIAVIAVKQ